MTVRTPDASYQVRLQVPGLHNVRNALAACAVAHALRMCRVAVARGLLEFEGAKGRLQRKRCRGGGVLIDDTYNANPDSMRAAIAVLAAAPGTAHPGARRHGRTGRRGDPPCTRQSGALAKEAGIDALLTLGELSAAAASGVRRRRAATSRTSKICVAALEAIAGADVTVLVKGSRFMRMERVVWRFVDGEPAHADAGEH